MIAMVIVAAIAIFTIPKILTVSQNSDDEKWQRAVKQSITEVDAAYGQYRLNNRSTPPFTFTLADATQYLNYVKQETVAQIDGTTCFGAAISCSDASSRCYKLKNGSMLHWYPTEDFGNTSATNAVKFRIDPDGKVTGAAGLHPGKAVVGYLYYKSGKIRTRQGIDANTYGGTGGGAWGPDNPGATCEPNWWNWN